jgi:pimeloyl-ACP methyl ester carboxylesterase
MTTDRQFESVWTHLYNVSFTQGWIDVNGVKTRYVQAGNRNAPAVLMMHGTGGSWEAFCANIGAHSRDYNCFAFDSLGSGFTDKPDRDYQIADYVEHIRGFMQAVDVKQASLIGISLGSWVAAQFALTHPDKVRSLTLNATFGLTVDPEDMKAILARRNKAHSDPSWENVRGIFGSLIHDETRRLDDFVAVRQTAFRQPQMQKAYEHILSVLGPHIEANLIPAEQWRRIRAPTLVVYSSDDRPIFVKTAKEVSKLIPNVRTLELEKVGHWPQFEVFEKFNERNLAFLREVVR